MKATASPRDRVSVPLCILITLWLFLLSGNLFAAVPLSEVLSAEQISVRNARLKLINAAGQYQGIPYRYGGRDRKGLDCSGLIYLSFQDALGVSVPLSSEQLYRWVEPVPSDAVQIGDLIFFKTSDTISHVGIYIGDGKFIHSASSGPKTGVIYSTLDEDYWLRTYVGAGRALPPEDDLPVQNPVLAAGRIESPVIIANAGASRDDGKAHILLLGVALAPSWGSVPDSDSPLRGGTVQFRIAYDLNLGIRAIRLGFELRPDWDAALGVVRFPFTFSLGFDDIFRIFAGPAFTLGNPVLKTSDGGRRYIGGNTWLGEVGITVAPFSFKVGGGALSPYGEIAWRSFVRGENQDFDWKADVGAGIRISTGIRYTWGI
ncbi:MAG: C40 family peptidase [Spirochaetaceae bacterium]|jgi:probable lipoprotein NlpC|nr:C40 family peptidase [Spirochaetaceae bacterium]